MECPGADEVRNEVLRLVAPRTQFSSPLSVSARTRLNDRRQFELTLETNQAGAEGERVFTGRTCRAVTDAAIVTMALSLDPNLELPKNYGEPPPSSAAPATPEVAAPAPVPEVAAPAPAVLAVPAPVQAPSTATMHVSVVQFSLPVPSPSVHGYLRSLAGWRWGSLPESSGELGLSVGLRRARLSSQLSLSFSPQSRTAYSHQLHDAGGTFSMQAAELTACWAILDGAWRVAPCLGLAFTHIAARGIGVSPLREGRLYWMSPQLALQGSYQLSGLIALYLGGAGYVALQRPEAYLGESDRIFRPGVAAYQLAGGGELQIW